MKSKPEVYIGTPQKGQAQLCPSCGALLDGHMGMSDEAGPITPEVGSPTLCMYCGVFLEFGPGLRLMRMTPETRARIQADPITWAMLTTVRDDLIAEGLLKPGGPFKGHG